MEKRGRKSGKHVWYCLGSKRRQCWRQETTANTWNFVVLYDFSLVILILGYDISGWHSNFIAEFRNGAGKLVRENFIPTMLSQKYMAAERRKISQWNQEKLGCYTHTLNTVYLKHHNKKLEVFPWFSLGDSE